MSVKCLDNIGAKVLIDNGSSLNVMPKATLDKLPFNALHLRPSSMVVRAFDDSRHKGRDRSPNSNHAPHMSNYLPSNGHKSYLQPLIRSTLDSFSWGGPVNVAPEVKICGGGAADYSIRRGRYTCKLFVFYDLG